MARQAVKERLDRRAELRRLGRELRQGGLKPVRDPHLPPAQGAEQLVLVVARHGESGTRRDHAHGEPEHAGGVRPAVHQVAEEDGAAAPGVRRVHRAPAIVSGQRVAELLKQGEQLGQAAVHVADHVERPGLVPQVAEQLRPGDGRLREFGLGVQHVNGTEALALQVLDGLPQRRLLPPDHVRAEVAVWPLRVAGRADGRRQVEDDRDRQHVVLAGELDQRQPRLRLHAGRVHDGQPAGRQPLARDVVQHVERVRGGRLVALVVGHQAAAEVRGDHLGRLEVLAGERRLARSRDTDKHHERQLGDGKLPAHAAPPAPPARVNTASCVGDPAVGDSRPAPENRTL